MVLRRRLLFAFGDLLFLMFSAAIAAETLAACHRLIGSFITAALAGMVVAMVVQMMIAAVAAPVLGSIETMVPSMVAGMLATGLVCVVAILTPVLHGHAVWLGAAAGAISWAGLLTYEQLCTIRFARRDEVR